MSDRNDRKDKGEEKEFHTGIDINLGRTGVLGGIGSLLSFLNQLDDTGELRREGRFGSKEQGVEGVYGFRVRMGIDGAKVRSFGNIRSTPEGPTVTEVREPLVDCFAEDGEVVVIVELPGVAEDDINLRVSRDQLELRAVSKTQKYGTEVLLPMTVDPDPVFRRLNHGILELRFRGLSQVSEDESE
jgi:HSP20 family protein